METRNILDHLGNVIGTLTLPDTTSEGEWSAALAPYALASVPVLVNYPPVSTATVTSTSTVTTSSSTPSVIGGMSFTPAAGKYVALFNGSIYTGGASATGEFGIYVDGTLVAESRRDISCNLTLLGGLVTISLNAIGVGTYSGTEITLTAGQTIDVRFRSTNAGTIGFKERVFTLLKVQ